MEVMPEGSHKPLGPGPSLNPAADGGAAWPRHCHSHPRSRGQPAMPPSTSWLNRQADYPTARQTSPFHGLSLLHANARHRHLSRCCFRRFGGGSRCQPLRRSSALDRARPDRSRYRDCRVCLVQASGLRRINQHCPEDVQVVFRPRISPGNRYRNHRDRHGVLAAVHPADWSLTALRSGPMAPDPMLDPTRYGRHSWPRPGHPVHLPCPGLSQPRPQVACLEGRAARDSIVRIPYVNACIASLEKAAEFHLDRLGPRLHFSSAAHG